VRVTKGSRPIDAAACEAAAKVCACFNLRRASRAASQFFDAILQPSGLRSTQFVLLALVRAGEPIAPARLAQSMVMDRSTLSRNIRPLANAGLLVSGKRKGARGTALALTPKGVRTLTAAVPLWEKAQRKLVEGIGPGRWAALAPLLERVAGAPSRS